MSIFNELYERTLARLLADHTAKGVPPDLDLWPTIQQRLIERDEATERATEKEQAGLVVNATSLPMQPQRPAEGRGRRLLRSTGALAGMATFALLAVVTTLAISGLANRAERESQMSLSRASSISELMFSIPSGQGNFQNDALITGFTIADDGTFWIRDASNHLTQFSVDGKLLRTLNLPGPIFCFDLKIRDSNIWVLGRQGDGSGNPPSSLYRLNLNGQELAKYELPTNLWAARTLLLGEEGDVLVQSEVYNDELSQIIDKNGTFNPQLLKGYTSKGKLYSAKRGSISSGPNYGNTAYIQVDNTTANFTIPYRLAELQILQTSADGSFFVLASDYLPSTGYASPQSQIVLHFDAGGKLSERAPKSTLGDYDRLELMQNVALSPDGQLYAVVPQHGSESRSVASLEVRRVNFFKEVIPSTPAPTLGPRAPIADDTTLVFSLPVGKDGISYTKYPTGDSMTLGFAAAAPDGTFWLADGDTSLIQYDAKGKRLGSIPLPANKGSPFEMQIREGNFWLYYNAPYIPGISGGYNEANTLDTIYHLGSDGREIAKYTVPDYIKERTMSGFRAGFILGEEGEVLLKGEFTNLIPGSSQFPKPVPTEQMPQTPTKLYWKLVDAQGNPAAEPLEGYTSGGRLYIVRQPYRALYGKGDITVGDVEITIPRNLRGQFNAFDLLQVAPDGSFYVKVDEEDDLGGPYVTTSTTIYHYSVDGKMIERAQLPMKSARLLSGHPGSFYVIEEQPGWEQRGTKNAPDKIEIRRLTFHPEDQPLPMMPTPEPPAPPTPILPTGNTPTPNILLPTATYPIPATTTALTNTDTGDLREMKAKSDIVAQVRIFGYNRVSGGHSLSMEVQRWLWQSTFLDTKTLKLYVPDDLWDKLPQSFQGNADPMTQDRLQQSVYILFLNLGGPPSPLRDYWGDSYSLTDGLAGAFMVSGGYIRDAAILKYNGWPVDAFSDAITNAILTTPTASEPAQSTPTRLPGTEPVSFVRDGEGFRLDVHEGAASFGVGSAIRGSSPWIGPSRLAVRWYPILTQGESKSYMLNIENGKLETLPWSSREWSAVSRADGKRVVLVKAGDSALTVNLFDMETGASETIFDFAPTTKQWAGADTHIWDFGAVPLYGYAETTWISKNNFVLSLTPRIDRDTTDYAARLLLVDIAHREVRLLAARGTLADPRPNFPLLWQSGGVDGGLQILNPPYTGQSTIITPGGPWIRDWALSPDGQRVAWVEAKAPPGDWSRKLPYTCRPCGGKDPEPEVQSIAVWDRATGQIERSTAPNLIWSLGDNTTQQSGSLHWRNDASTLLYATHIADKGGTEGAGQTALRELTSDGRSTLLTEYAWYGNLEILWEAKDRTVYYYMTSQSYSGSGSIVRLRPGSKIETLYPQTSHQMWRIYQEGRLAVLRQQGITVTDLTNGQAREALFPQAGAGEFDLGWSSISYLIPLSPDGLWAAFAGSNSDEVTMSPDGKPDRGRVVYIAPVK